MERPTCEQDSWAGCDSPFLRSHSIESVHIYPTCRFDIDIWVVLQKLSHFKCTKFYKLTTNFFNFFDWDQKYKCPRHHFLYLAQLIAPRGRSGAIQIFSIPTMELPSPWSPQLWIFFHHSLHGDRFAFAMVSIWLLFSSYRHPIHRRNSSSLHKNDRCSSFGKYQVLLCLPRIKFLYDSILFSIIGINPSLN